MYTQTHAYTRYGVVHSLMLYTCWWGSFYTITELHFTLFPSLNAMPSTSDRSHSLCLFLSLSLYELHSHCCSTVVFLSFISYSTLFWLRVNAISLSVCFGHTCNVNTQAHSVWIEPWMREVRFYVPRFHSNI